VKTANLLIHESQFPENVRRDLLASWHSRAINHKFHYDSVKQTHKWLALHQQFSPARYDKNCHAIYDQSFRAVTAQIKSKNVHLIGLGCGGGQKDTRLLKLLKSAGKNVFYTPSDVSAAMVLTARKAALAVLPEKNCFPFVCDLATANNLGDAFSSRLTPRASRLFTFFGMIPNFEPQEILPKLAALVRPKDTLLFSANLAPGNDYVAGVKQILPQYDNPLTRDWVMTFLTDLGVESSDGQLRFEIESMPLELKRIVANFHFHRPRRINAEGETFHFKKGHAIRLFFSYRYTPPLITRTLARYGLKVTGQWIAKSEEEGVFLCCVR
jgi:L-histidine Nalpha-methyltransferase